MATLRHVHTSTSLHIHILYTHYTYYTHNTCIVHTVHVLYTHITHTIHTIHVLYTQYMYYTHNTCTIHTQYMYYTHSIYMYVPTCTNCTQGAYMCTNQLHMLLSFEVWGQHKDKTFSQWAFFSYHTTGIQFVSRLLDTDCQLKISPFLIVNSQHGL